MSFHLCQKYGFALEPDLDLASRVMLSTPTARREQAEAFLYASCQAVIYHAHGIRISLGPFAHAFSIGQYYIGSDSSTSSNMVYPYPSLYVREMDETASLSATLVESSLYLCLSRGVMGGFALNLTRIATTPFSTSYCLHIEVAIKILMQGEPTLHPMGSRSSDRCAKCASCTRKHSLMLYIGVQIAHIPCGVSMSASLGLLYFGFPCLA